MSFLGIMIGLVLLSVFVIVSLFFMLLYKNNKYPGDDPIVYNFMTKYVPSAVGIQIQRYSGPDREAIMLRKYDKNYLQLFKEKKKTKDKDYLIFFNENQLSVFPKGTLSPDRDILILLPPSPEDLSEEFRNTPVGKAIAQVTEGKNYDKKLAELLREYSDRKDAILQRWGGGEISSNLLEHIDALFKDYTKTIIKDKGHQPQSFYDRGNLEQRGRFD